MNGKRYYLFKLGLSYIITFFLLISLVFIFLRIAPGDPVQRYLSPQLSPELYNRVKENFSLDKPVLDQYIIFISNFIRGDLGISYNYLEPVSNVIMRSFPFTLVFTLLSFFIQVLLSLILIIFISGRRKSLIDKIFDHISLTLYSLPTFIIGLGLIYIFSVQLEIFPSSDLISINSDMLSFSDRIIDYIVHLTLPLITISLPGTIIFYRYLRDNIEATYQKNFIQLLFANGYKEKIIFTKHILPNSLSPLISIFGVELGLLLGGALITESLFGLPGMGKLTVESILNRDYPLVVGCVSVSAIFVILANFLSDILKFKIDKRLMTNEK